MTFAQLYQEGPGVYLPVLALGLVITALAYGLAPVALAHLWKKPLTRGGYLALCFGANLVPLAAFWLLGGTTVGAPWLLWSWIFSGLGIRVLKSRELLAPEEGSRTVSLLLAAAVLLGAGCGVLLQRYQALELQYAAATEQLAQAAEANGRFKEVFLELQQRYNGWATALAGEMQQWQAEALEAQSELEAAREKAEFLEQYIVIVPEDGTGLFHKYGCPRLHLDEFRAFHTNAALLNGYKPCPECR